MGQAGVGCRAECCEISAGLRVPNVGTKCIESERKQHLRCPVPAAAPILLSSKELDAWAVNLRSKLSHGQQPLFSLQAYVHPKDDTRYAGEHSTGATAACLASEPSAPHALTPRPHRRLHWICGASVHVKP